MNNFFDNNKKEIISILILVVLLPILLVAGLSYVINQVFAEVYDILFVIVLSFFFVYGLYEIYNFIFLKTKKFTKKDGIESNEDIYVDEKTNINITFFAFIFINWIFYLLISVSFVVNFFSSSSDSNVALWIISVPLFIFIITNVFLTIDPTTNLKDQTIFSIISMLLLIFFFAFSYILIYYSFSVLFLILISTSLNDMSAYFFGKKWGNTKLSPSISPNKTVFGFAMGIVVSLLFGIIWFLIFLFPDYAINYMFLTLSVWKIILIILLISFISPIGDLFFSKIKREYKEKDFGNLIPEHGGLLDRIDSHIFTTITALLIILI